jgi:hypothetical protein
VKLNFRRRLIRRILININQDLKMNISVRQGMEMKTSGWCDVSDRTIANCCLKSDTIFSSDTAESYLEDIRVTEEV